MNDKPGWEAQYQIDTLRADLAKAQAESEAAAKRWDEENASLAAQLAKAQARCADLKAALTQLYDSHQILDDMHSNDMLRRETTSPAEEKAWAAITSDGTSALAAVRLAQRLVKMVTPPKERPADLGLNRREKLALEVEKALTEAFGGGE